MNQESRRWIRESLSLLTAMALSSSGCASRVQHVLDKVEAFPIEKATYTVSTVPHKNTFKALAFLEQRLNELGIRVYPLEFQTLYGYADRQNKRVYYSPSLTVAGRLETIAHEAAHILGPAELFLPEKGQVFADTVSTLTMRHFGIDNSKVSIRYMSQFKRHVPDIRPYEAEIKRVVNLMTEGW